MSAILPPLDTLDPADAWKPWRPTADNPWGRKWAAHLYRRAAFGGTRAELARAEKRGPDDTLDLLLRGSSESEELTATLTDVGRIAASRDDDGEQLRGWWLYCILQGGHPLREKLTLFWHNHFATSIAKVRDANLMFHQNCLLREHALGKFGPMLQAISRDGAMLLWLDSNSNVKGRPNENYARELMELFSLGVGHYTERDVREAARAFTGWHTNGAGFHFNAAVHDGGAKKVLGRIGKFDGGDVVRIVLEQPAAAQFLVGKLYAQLVSEIAPPVALLEPLCESFRASEFAIAALVKTMLSSRLFYSEHAFRKRIKSPVEYTIGAVRAVYQRYAESDANFRPLPQRVLVARLAAMGQALFAPPNVKGWPGGKVWLNTSTVLERDNFAADLALGRLWWAATGKAPLAPDDSLPPPRALDAARLLDEEGARGPDEIVRVLLDHYVPGGVRPDSRAKLVAYLATDQPTGVALSLRVREAVHAILTMPEYQLA